MDDLDASSNCSEFSNNSDFVLSNTSSLSNLSDYKTEFLALKSAVSSKSEQQPDVELKSSTSSVSDIHSVCKQHIGNLQRQLQDALLASDKNQRDFYTLEKKIELSFHDKIEKLIQQKNQLQVQLTVANKHIEKLLENYGSENSDVLRTKLIELERSNHTLHLQNSQLQEELNEFKHKNIDLQSALDSVRLELGDTKTLIEAKDQCIEKLKDKISQQHVDYQKLVQSNTKISNMLLSTKNELSHNQKSEMWYREQLHLSQKQKQFLLEENAEDKKLITFQKEKIQELTMQVSNYKNDYEQCQLALFKEREGFLKKLSTVKNQKESKSEIALQTSDNASDIEKICFNYEKTIKELSQEIVLIKNSVSHYTDDFQKMNKENSELTAKCVKLQKDLQDRENNILLLENKLRSSNDQLLVSNKTITDLKQELLMNKKEISKLTVEILSRDQEKSSIETTVFAIRGQFSKLKLSHEKLKNELHLKNKQILQLEAAKQELFMNNNWKVCELEKTKEKDLVIDKLKQKLVTLETEKTELLGHQEQLVGEYDQKILFLQNSIEEYKMILKEEKEKYKRFEEAHQESILKCKAEVSEYQNELNIKTLLISDQENSLKTLNDNIECLKREINLKNQELMHMQTEYLSLERMFGIKLDDLNHYKAEIENENHLLKKNVANLLINNSKHSSETPLGHTIPRDVDEVIVHNSCRDGTEQSQKHLTDNTVDSNCLMSSSFESGVFTNATAEHSRTNSSKSPSTIGLRSKLYKKLKYLEDKSTLLGSNIQTSLQLLEQLRTNSLEAKASLDYQEEVKKLKALLQVKDLEKIEIRKRHEASNRILLRKVKEHMKGRNTVEKQNTQLQHMYNELAEECNSLKIQVLFKEEEVMSLKELLKNQSLVIQKLKNSNQSLEKEFLQYQKCDRCSEFDLIIKQNESLKNSLANLREIYDTAKLEMNDKDELITKLKKESNELGEKLSKISEQYAHLNDEKASIEASLNSSKSAVKTLQIQLSSLLPEVDKWKKYSEQKAFENESLQKMLDGQKQDIDCLKKEIECLNSDLQQKLAELEEYRTQKNYTENFQAKKEENNEKLIMSLNSELRNIANELDSARNEKFFLQRLCNDLKTALHANMSQNKLLKEKVSNLYKEQEYNSLPNILPTSSKYDEDYINNLLLQNKTPVVLVDIQHCLDSLKKEVVSLKNQVIEKDAIKHVSS